METSESVDNVEETCSDAFMTTYDETRKMKEEIEEHSGDRGGEEDVSVKIGNEKRYELAAEIPEMRKVVELHDKLNLVAGSLSLKVGDVLKKQENEFLAAYRAHMYNVQKELQDLRNKVENAEFELQKDEKIKSLTQERDWFRTEALRLDTFGTALRKEVSLQKERIEELDNDRDWLRNQLKQAKEKLRCFAKNETRDNSETEIRISTESPVSRLERKEMQTQSASTLPRVTIPVEKCDISLSKTAARHLKEQLSREREEVRRLRAKLVDDEQETQSLRKLFLDCVDEVKKEIARRKHCNAKHLTNANFTGPDKVQIMNKLLANKNVLQNLL